MSTGDDYQPLHSQDSIYICGGLSERGDTVLQTKCIEIPKCNPPAKAGLDAKRSKDHKDKMQGSGGIKPLGYS